MGRELHFPELTIFLEVELALNASHQHKKVRKKKERKKKKKPITLSPANLVASLFSEFIIFHVSFPRISDSRLPPAVPGQDRTSHPRSSWLQLG